MHHYLFPIIRTTVQHKMHRKAHRFRSPAQQEDTEVDHAWFAVSVIVEYKTTIERVHEIYGARFLSVVKMHWGLCRFIEHVSKVRVIAPEVVV